MNEVPHGTVGRLAVRGPTGCRYLNDERQNAYVRDGWNLTGDSFIEDEDGFSIESNVIPPGIKNATAEAALRSLTEELIPDIANPGSVKVSPIRSAARWACGRQSGLISA